MYCTKSPWPQQLPISSEITILYYGCLVEGTEMSENKIKYKQNSRNTLAKAYSIAELCYLKGNVVDNSQKLMSVKILLFADMLVWFKFRIIQRGLLLRE